MTDTAGTDPGRERLDAAVQQLHDKLDQVAIQVDEKLDQATAWVEQKVSELDQKLSEWTSS